MTIAKATATRDDYCCKMSMMQQASRCYRYCHRRHCYGCKACRILHLNPSRALCRGLTKSMPAFCLDPSRALCRGLSISMHAAFITSIPRGRCAEVSPKARPLFASIPRGRCAEVSNLSLQVGMFYIYTLLPPPHPYNPLQEKPTGPVQRGYGGKNDIRKTTTRGNKTK